jgi:hypothetical protein
MNVKYPMVLLASKEHKIERLEVQSFEMNIYLVRITIDGKTGFVSGKDDSPMRFYSTQMVKDMFAHCDVANAVITQDTPYDEMIGNPEKVVKTTDIPFSMAQPY